MGNVLQKQYLFFNSNLILSELLPSHQFIMRDVDVLYVAKQMGVIGKRQNILKTCGITICTVEINPEYHPTKRHDNLPTNDHLFLFETEYKRVSDIFNVLLNEYISVNFKQAHLCNLKRQRTKQDYTSCMDVESLMKQTKQIYGFNWKSNHTIKHINDTLERMGYSKRNLGHITSSEVLDVLYYIIDIFEKYIIFLRYGMRFYGLYTNACEPRLLPRISPSTILKDCKFNDLKKFNTNICIKINPVVNAYVRNNITKTEKEALYICLVNCSNKKIDIMFSTGC
jgi:hypothetical protein